MFLSMLIAPLGSTFGAITSVNQALGALGRIQEILDLPTETQGDAALATRVRDADDRRAGSPGAAIEFRDVHFRYPEALVAARRTAESEALAVLENAHVDAYSMSGTEDLAPTPVAGEVLRGVSFSVPRGARVGSATPGTRFTDATRDRDDTKDHEAQDPPIRPLTSEGRRNDAPLAASRTRRTRP